MNIVNFKQHQYAQFDALIQHLLSEPEQHFHFSCLQDVYAAEWITQLPKSATFQVSGLDDGAENYTVCVRLDAYVLMIDVQSEININYQNAVKQITIRLPLHDFE